MKQVALVCLVMFCSCAWAQEAEQSKLSYGVKLGGYQANAQLASFYNGTGTFGIERVLSIPQHEERVENELDVTSFWIGEYPQAMRYNVALSTGVTVLWAMKPNMKLLVEVDYQDLKLTDVFTLYSTDPIVAEPVIHQFTIDGAEKRLDFNVGLQHYTGGEGAANFFFSYGGNLNFLRPSSNTIYIGSIRYSLLRTSSQGPQYGGIGYGGYAGAGVHYGFNEKWDFEFGANAFGKLLKLDETSGFFLETIFYCRLLFKNS